MFKYVSLSSSFTRTEPPFARTSSIIFNASTIGMPSSMSCMVTVLISYQRKSNLCTFWNLIRCIMNMVAVRPSKFTNSRMFHCHCPLCGMVFSALVWTFSTVIFCASSSRIIFPSLRLLTSLFDFKRFSWWDKEPLLPYSFFTNRQRIAFSTARIITPTSAKIARYIFAIPTAPNARQANFTTSAIEIFW